MQITSRDILKVIEDINHRKSEYYLSVKTPKNTVPNIPVGIDSIALILHAKVEDIEPVIDDMIAFHLLEQVAQKTQVHSGRKGWKKVRLKE
jgi:hypothetical protein